MPNLLFLQSTLLKKSTLDRDQLSNYHPITNLPLISKIIECIVKSRLTDHLTSNKLLNPHQSAYCKHHSTCYMLQAIRPQQDNAPSHRARYTIKQLQQETPDFIGPNLWPPNSTNLSLVDCKVWGVM